MYQRSSQSGAVNPLVISNIIVSLIAISLAGVAVWSYTNYSDQKNNVDSKIEAAVTTAKKEQSAADAAEFAEREKSPTREFVGPVDLGRVSFQYPKTWSVYVADDGTRGEYAAYLHPLVVSPVSSSSNNPNVYALRVEIKNRVYEEVLKGYEGAVEKGDLKSAPITVGGFSGIRLAGTIDRNRKGTIVVFKVRDKTLTLTTDTEAFVTDFDNTILETLSFNP